MSFKKTVSTYTVALEFKRAYFPQTIPMLSFSMPVFRLYFSFLQDFYKIDVGMFILEIKKKKYPATSGRNLPQITELVSDTAKV